MEKKIEELEKQVDVLEKKVDVLSKLVKIVHSKSAQVDPNTADKFLNCWIDYLENGHDWQSTYYKNPQT